MIYKLCWLLTQQSIRMERAKAPMQMWMHSIDDLLNVDMLRWTYNMIIYLIFAYFYFSVAAGSFVHNCWRIFLITAGRQLRYGMQAKLTRPALPTNGQKKMRIWSSLFVNSLQTIDLVVSNPLQGKGGHICWRDFGFPDSFFRIFCREPHYA